MITSFRAHKAGIYRIKQSPYNNGYVATASYDKTVNIWTPSSSLSNSDNWTLIQTYTGHSDKVYGLEFVNIDTVASGSDDRTIQIWTISTGDNLMTINTENNVYALQLLSNGIFLASGLSSATINIYDVNTGDLIETLYGHTGYVNDLILMGVDLLASSSEDNSIRIWNLTSNTNVFNLTENTENTY